MPLYSFPSVFSSFRELHCSMFQILGSTPVLSGIVCDLHLLYFLFGEVAELSHDLCHLAASRLGLLGEKNSGSSMCVEESMIYFFL